MRILYVSHDFLPAHAAGTEIYTGSLARRMQERGHEVLVFTTEKDISRPQLSVVEREWQGVPVRELTNNLFYDDFRETWDWPPAVAALGRVLDEFRPDVVHFMHLLYLSAGCVEEVRRRGLALVYTLHDFWLQCARFGQRIHADGAVCHDIDFARCGTCLASLAFSQSPLQRRTARVIAGVRSLTGLDLGQAARRAARGLQRPAGDPRAWVAPPAATAQAFARAMATRDDELRRRIVPAVDRFFAPSRFLRERFLEWGIEPERIEHLTYGLEQAPFEGFRRSPSALVRVTFLGTLAPHKGPDVLLAAWGRLPSELRAGARLVLHGPKDHFPDYVARLEAAASELGAELPGKLAPERLAAALAETDLLVVPSTWYENSPLTIHEARATRTPLLVSDLGGMAELVEPGRDGWRFAPGDANDLARLLTEILANPARLEQLDFRGEAVKDMRQSAEEMEARYRTVLENPTR